MSEFRSHGDTSDLKEEKRILRERRTIALMIELYCAHHHHPAIGPCDRCRDLLKYALERIEHCPHGREKTVCSACGTHCFNPAMRAGIRRVMAYSGPRMLLRHPLLTLHHLLEGSKRKR